MSKLEDNGYIIGHSLSQEVQSQLAARKKILSNPKYSSDPSKNSNDYINYTSGNTGWVRICSSADIQDTNGIYSSESAKQNELLGGTLNYGRQRKGILSDMPSYDSTQFGLRPMAGIVNMSVENRSYGGALRLGTFEVVLNSLEQLSTLEQLYMRPGYTVFIEYGHSIHITGNGEVVSDITYLRDYFDYTNKEQIIKEASEIRDTVSEYNYDFMFAYITNFTWQTTEIGSYLATVTFTTQGDLIDSLTTAVPAGGKIDEQSNSSISLKDKTTALHNILWVIDNTDTEKYYDKETIESDPYKNIRTQEKVEKALEQYCSPVWKNIKDDLTKPLTIINTQIGDTSTGGTWFKYISLGFLFDCINNIFIPTSKDDVKLFKFDTTKYSKFTTFKQHFCIDPAIAVLPKERFTTGDTNFKYRFAEQEQIEGDIDDIRNIHINIKLVTDLLHFLASSDEVTDSSIYVFVEKILNKLTTNLGNINDFDLHFDDDIETFFAIDRTVLPPKKTVKDTRYKLDVFGIGTTVEKFTMGSTVPSSMVGMLAVSAAANSTDLRNGSHSLFRWNSGIKDRVLGDIKLDGLVKDQLDSMRNEMIALARYLKNCNESAYYTNYNKEEVNAIRPLYNKIMSILLEYYTNNPDKPEDKLISAGLIPITLKLTMKGIAGLKIGEAFTVPDEILPSRYREKVAFQITRLKNTVNDNKWLTDIDAIMFPLDVPEDTSNEVFTIPKITVEDLEREFTDALPPPTVEVPEILFSKPISILKTRSDSQGDGSWLANRRNSDGTRRRHTGWDVEAAPFDTVYAPIDGQVFKNLNFGAHGHPVLGILGTGDYNGFIVLLGYCDWIHKFVTPTAKRGDVIGQVVELARPYGSVKTAYPKDMKNHIHIKVTYNGQVVDPSILNYV